MGKRKPKRWPQSVDEKDPGPGLFEDWDDDGEERVRIRPQRPKDEVVTPRRKERRRRREVIEF